MTQTVLILGVYLVDKENLASQITADFKTSRGWEVEQRWVAVGVGAPDSALASSTVLHIHSPVPKFSLLNRLLREVDTATYEYLIVSDDDIVLPPRFLDNYLAMVAHFGFALAQPARTHDSYIDHPFVEQLDGIDARWTRFVEIGPLFSLHNSAFEAFLPFDEASAMGWGYDFVWPCIAEERHLKMGIVDALPVAHNLRKPVTHYDYGKANKTMSNYLAKHPHLSKAEAFYILDSYV